MPGPAVPIESLLAHREWVRALARRLVKDPSAADDLEQEAWLAALRHPPRDDSSLRGWFGTLLRSRARDSWRGEGRRAERESSAPPARPSPTPVEIVSQAEAHRRVVDAVLALEEPYRATVLHCYFEGLTPREVAERMGVPLETVRTRLRRALERLRERFDREEDGSRAAWIAVLLPITGSTGADHLPAPPSGAWPSLPLLAGAAAAVVAAGGIWLATGPGSTGALPRSADEEGVSESGGAPAPVAALASAAAEAEAPASPGGPAIGPAPAVSPRTLVSIRVLDLADGGAAAGVSLAATLPDGSSLEATTDGGGLIQLPAEGLGKVHPRDNAWRVPRYAEGEILAAREMWIYRTVPVEGEVRFVPGDADPNPASVTLSCTTSDLAPAPGERAGLAAPWEARWLRAHGIQDTLPLPSPDLDGSFFVRVPRIRGARLLARLAGWIGDAALVPTGTPGAGPAEVGLVLREAARVSGVLRDGTGAPLAGVAVEFHLTFRLPPGDDSGILGSLRALGGYTLRTGADGTTVSLVDGQATGRDGAFEFPAMARGSGLLFVPPSAAYGPLAAAVGAVEETSLHEDLVLAPLDESRRTRLTWDGTPAASTALLLVDLSCGDAQPAVRLSTDERGEIAAGSLIPGHRYVAIVMDRGGAAPPRGEFVWTGVPGDVSLGGDASSR